MRKSAATLKYGELTDILRRAFCFDWDTFREMSNKPDEVCIECPWSTMTDESFWAIISAQYFPFCSFEYAKNECQGVREDLQEWMVCNLNIHDITRYPALSEKL